MRSRQEWYTMTRLPLYDGYESATNKVAFFRRSGLALIEATGPDTVDFLQGMVTSDVKRLSVGASQRAALLDTKGHILADLILHRREKSIFVEADHRTLSRVLETLNRYIIMEDVTLSDRTSDFASFSLFGPEADELIDSPEILEIVDGSGWTVHRSPVELHRYDVWVPNSLAEKLNDYFIGSKITQISTETYEVLRIEAGEAAWGTELTEAVLLPEAEIPDIVSYTKGCYVGQEIIARLHSRGHTNRVLRQVLFPSPDHAIPVGSLIYIEGEDREVARITSVAQSPRFNAAWLALAYVRNSVADIQTPQSGKIIGQDGNVQHVEFFVLA
jgi:folate-binding protein YgfZ